MNEWTRPHATLRLIAVSPREIISHAVWLDGQLLHELAGRCGFAWVERLDAANDRVVLTMRVSAMPCREIRALIESYWLCVAAAVGTTRREKPSSSSQCS